MKLAGPKLIMTIAALTAASMLSSGARSQTPEETQAWEAKRAQSRADDMAKSELLARQRMARKADPMAWVRTLDPMPTGGWVFRAVGADGSWAVFSTDHQLKRSGRQVTVWLRQEYPEAQKSAAGDAYWSNVEKMQYDCAKDRARVLLVVYYSENNLAGSQQNEEADPKTVTWDAVVPGTQSDYIFQWACAAGNSTR